MELSTNLTDNVLPYFLFSFSISVVVMGSHKLLSFKLSMSVLQKAK